MIPLVIDTHRCLLQWHCTHKICAAIAKPSMWRAPHCPLSLSLSLSRSLCLSLHSLSKSQWWCSATGGVTPQSRGTRWWGSFGEGRGGGAWRVIGWDRLLSSDPTPLGTTLLPIVSVSHSGFFLFLWRSFSVHFQFYSRRAWDHSNISCICSAVSLGYFLITAAPWHMYYITDMDV